MACLAMVALAHAQEQPAAGTRSLLQAAQAAQLNTAAAPPATVAREQRAALVIGNSAYAQGALRNPVNDARAIAAKLRGLGFTVLLKENLKTRDIGAVYRDFRATITPGGVALVFYAGHGLQFKGQNYFPAVDADIQGEEEVPLQSLNLDTLLDSMDEARPAVGLVLLDACRDNPFAKRLRNSPRGLAKVLAASGTLVHYATKPGSVASDGDGANGTYTEALLAQMDAPGVPVELMLKAVTKQVVAKTKGQQEPWVEGSLSGDFAFKAKPQPVAAAAAPPAAAPAGLLQAFAFEDQDWNVAPTRKARARNFHAPTPTSIPGGQVLRTLQLKDLLERRKDVLVVDVLDSKDRSSIPGAVWMPGVGGGDWFDAEQARFAAALAKLTQGSKAHALVFLCLGSECWLSYNAALRALQAGYSEVYWYRGGTAAWQGGNQRTAKAQRYEW